MKTPQLAICLLLFTLTISLMWFLYGDRNGESKQTMLRDENKLQLLSFPKSNSKSFHKELETENWTPPQLPASLQDVYQDDAALVVNVYENWLLPPSTKHRQLKFPDTKFYSQRGQDKIVAELLQYKQNGFFIESGALEGEQLSNSLYLEKNLKWTGLLVEANPKLFHSIIGKHRDSFMINACLSPTRKSMMVEFKLANAIGGIANHMEKTHQARIQRVYGDVQTITVQCFPLYTILRAMNVTHVDYWSLDIEGAEIEVLNTLPLDEITVEVFSIEYFISDNPDATKKKLDDIKRHLVDKHGYTIMWQKYEDVILKRTN